MMIGLAIAGQSNRLPIEYLVMVVCRDYYHCVPSQLDEEDWERVMIHLELASVEAEVQERRSRHQPKKPSGTGGGASFTFATSHAGGSQKIETQYGNTPEHH